MNLREVVINKFKERRQKLLDGNVNSIPSPFNRFSNDFIGLEQGTYYLITSYTKGRPLSLNIFVKVQYIDKNLKYRRRYMIKRKTAV